MTVDPACPIVVSAETRYVSEQSDPGRDRYVFAYTITIRNAGTVAARLVSRHWVITDATGKVEEVRGDGVVGEQPVQIEPLGPGTATLDPFAGPDVVAAVLGIALAAGETLGAFAKSFENGFRIPVKVGIDDVHPLSPTRR